MGADPDWFWLRELELRMRGSAEGAARALAALDADPDPVVVGRLRLVIAMNDTRQGRFAEGMTTIRELRQWATEHAATHTGAAYLLARCERALSVVLRQAGDVTASLEHALAAVELLDEDDHPGIMSDHLTGLGDSLSVSGNPQQAIQRYVQALACAEQVDDQRQRVVVINNWTYTEFVLGHLDVAADLAARLQQSVPSSGEPLPPYAVDTVANVYLAAGRLQEAHDVLDQLIRDDDFLNPEDLAGSLLTLATVERARGELAGADAALDRCFAVCAEHDLGGVRVRALAEHGEVRAAQGRFREAYELYQQFHQQLVAQHTLEREGRADMMQAVFETAEARRESERLRELSYRDPLTQLRNRRYVDDHLNELLGASLRAGRPFSVAFGDLDHFKRINDTWSHEVGDAVLCQVAAVLQQHASGVPDGFVARMGGEEFLLVLPGVPVGSAHELLEVVRSTVAQQPLGRLASGLTVTASFGVATAPDDGTERLGLLTTADHRLYGAKHQGRNRVCSARSGPLPTQRHH